MHNLKKLLYIYGAIFFSINIGHTLTQPKFSITPLSLTNIEVPANGTASILYQITNNTLYTRTLTMQKVKGITQGSASCGDPFTLNPKQSCVLNLEINGDSLSSGSESNTFSIAPTICNTVGPQNNSPDPFLCSIPSFTNQLHITVTPSLHYTVGGNLTGLSSGNLVLQNNNSDNLTLTTNGSFIFTTPLAPNSPYSITVLSNPAGQICSVTNGSGTVTSNNINSVAVNCVPAITYTLGGNVSGLLSGNNVTLDDGNSNTVTVTTDGSFTFPAPFLSGTTYNVTVATQPTGQNCTVSNGSGIISSANVTNVQVTCTTLSFTLGGTLSGASGTVILQNNGGDNLILNSNGAFTFNTPVSYNTSYNVTVLTPPAGQICSVTNGSGTMPGTNVTNIIVSCTTPTYTIGGTVTGLLPSLNLTLTNTINSESLNIAQNGSFTFGTALSSGTNYNVQITTQPIGQTCSIGNGSGTISSSNISNINVVCGQTFVMANFSGNTYTSPDANTWTPSSANPISPSPLRAVAFGNNRFVTAGIGGRTFFSTTNGNSWTESASSPIASGATIQVATHGNGLFVAAGTNGAVATSADGNTWSTATSSPLSGGVVTITGATHNPAQSLFVLGDDSGEIYTSSDSDGNTWQLVASLPISITAITNNNSSTYVTVGGNTPYYSTDAINWTNSIPLATPLTAATYGNGTFVIGGNSGRAYFSTDGINWTPSASNPIGGGVGYNITKMTYGNGIFVLAASGGNIFYSTNNGNTWTLATSSPVGASVIFGMAYGG